MNATAQAETAAEATTNSPAATSTGSGQSPSPAGSAVALNAGQKINPALIPPHLGQVWPGQGGILVGYMRDRNGGPAFPLVAAPAEVIRNLGQLEYGPEDTRIDGADSYWDGESNTKALLAAGEAHPAADACAALEYDGHKDYFLPANDQMALVHANAGDLIPEGWYWHSTQYSPYHAWSALFPGGDQLINDKGYKAGVVPVRRVTLVI